MNPLLFRACVIFASGALVWLASKGLTGKAERASPGDANSPQPVADKPQQAKPDETGKGNANGGPSGGPGDSDPGKPSEAPVA